MNVPLSINYNRIGCYSNVTKTQGKHVRAELEWKKLAGLRESS